MRNRSTLVVLGKDGATAAAVSAMTCLVPTRAMEAGERPPDGSAHAHSIWHLEVKSGVEDESGFGSMRSLLAQILPAAPELRKLEANYEVRIDWGGFSDSSQGGFVLEPDVARGLSDLGLSVYGTAYSG